jgi:hypothetical protein
VFHLDVAKVDVDIAYAYILQVYVLCVSGVSYVCCKCFHLDVALVDLDVVYICNSYTCVHVFLGVFKCFSYFGRMLQVFYLDLSKVDHTL